MRRLLIILFLFLSLAAIGQNTYHVAKTGNDGTGDGSLGTPWLTITHGEATMTGGDTLYVHTGTYVERVEITGIDGTPTARTVIRNYGNDAVIIDGQNAGTDSEGDIIRIYDDYVDLYGFELRNANQDQGAGTDKGHCIETRGDNITISHCILHEALLSGVTSNYGDSIIIEYCTLYNLSMLNFDGDSPTGYWGQAVIITGVSGPPRIPALYPIFRGNIVHDIWGEGITVRNTMYALFEDNIIYDCFNAMLYVQNTRYAKVQRNIVYKTKDMIRLEPPTGSMEGIAIWDESYSEPIDSRITIINNLVYGCERNLVVTRCDTVVIVGNTFVNADHDDANVQIGMGEAHTKGYYANNIIDENDGTPPTSLIFVQGEGSDNITFKNNLYSRALSGEHEVIASDATDVEDDPELTKGDTGAGELSSLYFVPGATSPAIGAGLDMDDLLGIYYDTTNIYRDYLQYIRNTTPTIGALEVAGDPPDPAVLPTVQTLLITDYNAIHAVMGVNVISDGGGTLTARGICYGTSVNPTTSNSTILFSAITGSDSLKVTTLESNTTYYVRGYSTNEIGTSYGANVIFTTTTNNAVLNGIIILLYNGLPLIKN